MEILIWLGFRHAVRYIHVFNLALHHLFMSLLLNWVCPALQVETTPCFFSSVFRQKLGLQQLGRFKHPIIHYPINVKADECLSRVAKPLYQTFQGAVLITSRTTLFRVKIKVVYTLMWRTGQLNPGILKRQRVSYPVRHMRDHPCIT